jgi:deoxyribodipyrimidine photolyase
MPWSHDEQLFERWRDGKTGMPLVDANMRELKQTGGLLRALDMSEASFNAQQLLQRVLHESLPGLSCKAWLHPVRACPS